MLILNKSVWLKAPWVSIEIFSVKQSITSFKVSLSVKTAFSVEVVNYFVINEFLNILDNLTFLESKLPQHI